MGGYGDVALSIGRSRTFSGPPWTASGGRGFSDGASYAISMGITNGDLFTHAGVLTRLVAR
jgi:hypothetical protein